MPDAQEAVDGDVQGPVQGNALYAQLTGARAVDALVARLSELPSETRVEEPSGWF